MSKSIVNKIKETLIVLLVITHVPIMHIDSQWHIMLVAIMEQLLQEIVGCTIGGIHFQVCTIIHHSRIRETKEESDSPALNIIHKTLKLELPIER